MYAAQKDFIKEFMYAEKTLTNGDKARNYLNERCVNGLDDIILFNIPVYVHLIHYVLGNSANTNKHDSQCTFIML